jgi:hypothetical protein
LKVIRINSFPKEQETKKLLVICNHFTTMPNPFGHGVSFGVSFNTIAMPKSIIPVALVDLPIRPLELSVTMFLVPKVFS